MTFNPQACLSRQDFEIVVYALSARLLTPRFPRPGDVVWVRPFEEATWPWAESKWIRHDVDGVGMKNGVEVECTLDDGTILTRAYYHQTWRFDVDHGPKEVLS
jgi:hypothetical protein